MDTDRRDFVRRMVAGAAALPLLRTVAAEAAETGEAKPKSRDSKLMGKAKFIDVDGIRTRYFEGGKGEPLVLIHGGQWPATASADGWSPIFDDLAAHFHVYAFDKLGMGYTDNPKTLAGYNMGAVARHAEGFVKAIGVKKFVMMGHSRGMLPAAYIAVNNPELISHMVILDTNALTPGNPALVARPLPPAQPAERKAPTRESIRAAEMATKQSYMKDFLTDSYIEAEYQISQLPKIQEAAKGFRDARDAWVKANPEKVKENPKIGRNEGDVVWWLYEAQADVMAKINAGALKMPMVIIWGFNDPFATYPLGVDLMKTVSQFSDRTELHIINHSGHFVAAEHPKEVSRLVNGFILG
jgi:2-hydroxy-6-oxo-6-(2'-carboxyphenyl)-hexa-2,4-dienoate hydrolase